MTLTPYQRWQRRTNSGRRMAGGWVHKSIAPPREAQYEVRGHPHHCYLTWAYESWWSQSVGDDREGTSGSWHRQKGAFDWKGPIYNTCSVNWGSVVHQAAEMGNKEAQRKIEGWRREREKERACVLKENPP
mgnify:CR=1 FL=1